MVRSYAKGGKKLDAFLRHAERSSSAKGPVVEVGFVGDVAVKAIANEFGLPQHGIPERPFFRNAIVAAKPKVAAAAVTLIRARGYQQAYRLTETDMLKLAEIVADEIRKSIQTVADPTNRPRKRRSDPLVFAGELAKAVTIRVVL